MNKERINTLCQQTSFLLEKQKEFLSENNAAFSSLLSIVDDKLKLVDRENQAEQLKDLKAVYDCLAGHKQKSEGQISQDIEFLQEQLHAINQIKAIEDEAKAQELLAMMIDDQENLVPMDEFEKQVNADVESSKKELGMMLTDLKGVLEEENPAELKLLLEAICEKDTDADEQEGEDCALSCSGCVSESECKGGMDVFSAFSADMEKEKQGNDLQADKAESCSCSDDCSCNEKTEEQDCCGGGCD